MSDKTKSNIGKIKKLLKKHNVNTILEARAILEPRIQDANLLDDVIARLIDDDFLVLIDGDGNVIEDKDDADNEKVFVESYRRAMAVVFKEKSSMKRSFLKNKMSFELDWFTPSDADDFISFCLEDGVIVEDPDTGELKPNFDVSEVGLPFGWSLNDELQIETGTQRAQRIMDDKREQSEVKFTMGEYRDDLEKQLAEDGLFDDDLAEDVHVDVPFDGVEDRLESTWFDDRKRIVSALMDGTGIPTKKAYNVYDYYELNNNIIDKDMFKLTLLQFENITDEGIIDVLYDRLQCAGIRAGENV